MSGTADFKCEAMPPEYQPWSGYGAEHAAYEELLRAVRGYAAVRKSNGGRIPDIKKDMRKVVDHFDEWNQEPV